MKMPPQTFRVLGFTVFLALAFADCDYYDDECNTDSPTDSCVFSHCMPPNCSCFGVQPDIPLAKRPQFVMLTFDDAITVTNIDIYKAIARGRKNKANGQGIRLTFFVCHEYNDYELTRELYEQGHEIAVHSISHESNTDRWRRGSPLKWKQEMAGMRFMLSAFGYLPSNEIVGHRAPFLQTAGDTTFDMLQKEGFLYDSSMPTRSYTDPPIWPYTLDFGYSPQDCQIEPCPSSTYPGLWEVPMVQYSLKSKDGVFYCSMADACTPLPKTNSETLDYLRSNFRRHYHTTKAPFPVFLHEAWLRDPFRLQGYLAFVDELLQKDDVFLVSMGDVVEYMRSPVEASLYYSRARVSPKPCPSANSCKYNDPLRIMQTCAPCSPFYPWVGTPLGKKRPVFPHQDATF